jgi:mannan endo-1,4-beta-mannosidase
LRAITTQSDIRWMGAAVGRNYRLERATDIKGPWKIIAEKVSDGINKFDPATMTLFADKEQLAKGIYYYRVIAMNESGESAPSNIEKLEIR